MYYVNNYLPYKLMVWRLPPLHYLVNGDIYILVHVKKKLGASEILTQSEFILCEIGRQISTNGNQLRETYQLTQCCVNQA